MSKTRYVMILNQDEFQNNASKICCVWLLRQKPSSHFAVLYPLLSLHDHPGLGHAILDFLSVSCVDAKQASDVASLNIVLASPRICLLRHHHAPENCTQNLVDHFLGPLPPPGGSKTMEAIVLGMSKWKLSDEFLTLSPRCAVCHT